MESKQRNNTYIIQLSFIAFTYNNFILICYRLLFINFDIFHRKQKQLPSDYDKFLHNKLIIQ